MAGNFRDSVDMYNDAISLLKETKIVGSLDLIFDLLGVMDTAETEFADFRSKYLGEFEATFETALTRYSGA
jgi:hypothetical protein